MFENIRADTMRAFGDRKPERSLDVLRLLWTNHGLQVLVIYRFGRWLRELRKHRFGWIVALSLDPGYRLLSACAREAYDISLEPSADIAAGLFIGHFGGIEVKNCCIGPGCAIYQQVKLGPSDETTERGPVIGARVFIGPHVQIQADISVGEGSCIGAGAVITQDIPRHCLVLGNPGRIVQQDYDNRAIL